MDLIEEATRLALDSAGIKPESVQGIFTTPLSSLSDLDAADLLGTRIMADTSAQNTHLTRKQLAGCVSLIQNGVNPEALAVCLACAHWNQK